MDLLAITGFLHLKQGKVSPTEQMAGVIAQRAPRRADKSRRNDFLFAHLTLSSNQSEPLPYDALTQDLVESLAAVYFKTNGSINTALRQAVRHINGLLLNWNVENGGMRREGALTCAIMQRNELIIMQAGPSSAILGHNFGLERLQHPEDERATPLGQSVNLDIRFHHTRLKPGDMLLLADAYTVAFPTQAFQPVLVDTEVEIGIEELKELFSEQPEARLLLVEFSEEAPPDYPDRKTTIQTLNPNSGGSAPTLKRPAMPIRISPTQVSQKVEASARKGAAVAAEGVSRVVDGAADLLDQFDQPEPELTQIETNEPEGQTIPLFVAVIIPLLIGIILTNVYLQGETNAQMEEAVAQMRENIELAGTAEDDANRRAFYMNTLAIGERAETIRPQDSEVRSLMEEARISLDDLDSIFRLNAQLLYTYEDEESLLTAVEIDDQALADIYILDSGLKNVMRHPTNSGLGIIDETATPEEILFTGQAISGNVVGELNDLMWRPKGSQVTRDSLSILDSRGTLINYYPSFGDRQVIPLGLSSAWRQPDQIKPFSGRLYVLDGIAGYIWKYFPADDALVFQENNQAITFYDPASLGQAVDFDIFDTDGSVLILYSNGEIRRFFDGRMTWDGQKLVEGGLEEPMIAPTSLKILGQSSTSSFFVLDPASNRLLQFARNGVLVNQFRATDENGLELFSRARDFAVTPPPIRVVVITDNEVYIAQ